MGSQRYLLDTCTFLWLCADPGRLGHGARESLSEGPAELLLSDVAVLEIALKWAAGKITLPAPPRAWVEQQSRTWKLLPVPLSRATIYRSTELPEIHRDPFDRLLVATALQEEAVIVTPDESIHRYPVPWTW